MSIINYTKENHKEQIVKQTILNTLAGLHSSTEQHAATDIQRG